MSIIILIRIIVYFLERTIENRIIVFLKLMNNQLAANNFNCNNRSREYFACIYCFVLLQLTEIVFWKIDNMIIIFFFSINIIESNSPNNLTKSMTVSNICLFLVTWKKIKNIDIFTILIRSEILCFFFLYFNIQNI